MTTAAVVAAEPVRTETNVTEYMLVVKGVFGRNRSRKLQVIRLVDVPAGSPAISDSVIQSMVADKLTAIKAKSGLDWKVDATEVTISRTEGSPFVSRSFMMFTGKTVASGVFAC
jgi:hypothetical protein